MNTNIQQCAAKDQPKAAPPSPMTWAEAERLLVAELPNATMELRRDPENNCTKFTIFTHDDKTLGVLGIYESASLAGAVNAALAAHRAKVAAPDNLDAVMASAFEPEPQPA